MKSAEGYHSLRPGHSAAGQGTRPTGFCRKSIVTIDVGESGVPTCDKIFRNREPKWKSWLRGMKIMKRLLVAATILAFLMAPPGALKAQTPGSEEARQLAMRQVPSLVRQALQMVKSIGQITLENDRIKTDTFEYTVGDYNPTDVGASCRFAIATERNIVAKIRSKDDPYSGDSSAEQNVGFNLIYGALITGAPAGRGPEVWVTSYTQRRDQPGQIYDPGVSVCSPGQWNSTCAVNRHNTVNGETRETDDSFVFEHLPNQQFAARLQKLFQQVNDLCKAAAGNQ
jgi:hypothetical protein